MEATNPHPCTGKFLSRIKKTDACWLWVAATTAHYGHGVLRFKNKMVKAHRVSWEIFRGEVPEGMCVLHKCDIPNCVNPDHLFIGTQTDNMKDMDSKGRRGRRSEGVGKSLGSKNGATKMTDADIIAIREVPARRGVGAALAAKFGISHSSVVRIRSRETWAHI